MSLTAEQKQADPRTDEDRVNRKDKKGRIVAVAPVHAAEGFYRRLDPAAHQSR